MTGLPTRCGSARIGSGHPSFAAEMRSQETGLVFPATANVITPKTLRHHGAGQSRFASEVIERQLHKPQQRDPMRSARFRVQPLGPSGESGKRSRLVPEQGRGLDKVSTVSNQIPIFREPAQLL